MDIKKLITCCVFLMTVSSMWAIVQRDSLFNFSKWQTVDNYKLSDNGKWATVSTISSNRSQVELNIINTTNNTKKAITDLNVVGTISDFLVYKKSKDVIFCENLNTNTIVQFTIGAQIDLLTKSNVVAFISDHSVLNLYTTNKNEIKDLVKISNISKYFINPRQDIILAVSDRNSLRMVDVKTGRVKIIDFTNKEIKSVFWSNHKEIVLIFQNSDMVLFDYHKMELIPINLPIDTTKEGKANLTPIFLNNGNLMINTVVRDSLKVQDKHDDFLDIWNGNSTDLENKFSSNQLSTITSRNYLFDRIKKELTLVSPPNYLTPLINANPKYTLVYDAIKYKDYTTYVPQVEFSLFDNKTKTIKPMVDSLSFFNRYMSYSEDGRYLSYMKKQKLYIYDIDYNVETEIIQNKTAVEIIWNIDSKSAFVISDKEVLQLDLKNYSTKKVFSTSTPSKISLLNKYSLPIGINQGDGLIPQYVDSKIGLLFKVINIDNNANSLVLAKNKKVSTLYSTVGKLSQVIWGNSINTVTFSEENYNLPVTIKVFRDNKVSSILENNMPEDLYNWRKQDVIEFKDKYNNVLKGILYYPKGYDSRKLYPMIVSIYEDQFFKQNTFYTPKLNESTGFNIPILTSLGYFVFLPSTRISSDGPALSALNCVTQAIEKVTATQTRINKDKIGIIGNSYGGYLVNYIIITQTNLFATAISGVAISDIIWDYYSYNYNFPKPSYYKYENGQYGLNVSFKSNPKLYIDNNPILYAQNVQTPVLLYAGLKDYNVHWENTRHFYTALRRYDKKQIALFYKNEGHAIASKNTSKDLTLRVIDWFNYFLKDYKDCPWINDGL